MRRLAVLALCFATHAIAQDVTSSPGVDTSALQGSWNVQSYVVNGDPSHDEHVRAGRLVIAGDHYTPTFGSMSVGSLFKTDPAHNPRAIDFTLLAGPHCGKTVKGIYELSGDTLRVCRAVTESDSRPERFEAPAGSGHLLVVWKRSKSGSGSVAREFGRLQGTWAMKSALNDGHPASEKATSQVALTVLGTTVSVKIGGEVISHDVGLEIDPEASPKSITETVLDGPGKGTVIRGIYRLEGDTMTTCMALPDHERPTTFDAGPGTGRSLRIFQKLGTRGEGSVADGLEHLNLEGKWAFESLQPSATIAALGTIHDSRLTLRGNRFVSVNGRGTYHGTYSIDAEAEPRAIDLTFTDGPEAGHTLRGRYALDGQVYRARFASPDAPRPDRLDRPAGPGHVDSVMKRIEH